MFACHHYRGAYPRLLILSPLKRLLRYAGQKDVCLPPLSRGLPKATHLATAKAVVALRGAKRCLLATATRGLPKATHLVTAKAVVALRGAKLLHHPQKRYKFHTTAFPNIIFLNDFIVNR
jgi:hypothetical protein